MEAMEAKEAMEALPAAKRRRLQPQHAAAARELLNGAAHSSLCSSGSSGSGSGSSSSGSGSSSSEGEGEGEGGVVGGASVGGADPSAGDLSLRELLPGEYVHPAVRCAAVAGKELGLVLAQSVPGGTLLLRTAGLRIVPEAGGGSIDLADLFRRLASLARARPGMYERLRRRFDTMAPRPIGRAHRDAYIAKQSVAGPGASVEQRRAAFAQWLSQLLERAPGCSLANAIEALDLLVRLSSNIYDEGASAGVALMNHSCAPNVAMSCTLGDPSDPQQQSERPNDGGATTDDPALCCFDVWSVDTIDAGAELTPSYLSAAEQLMPTAARRAKLREWGFHCTCARCSSGLHSESEAVLTAMDCSCCSGGRCESLGPEHGRFAACSLCGAPPPAPQLVAELLSHVSGTLEAAEASDGDPETQWAELSALHSQLSRDGDASANAAGVVCGRGVRLHPLHWLMTRLHQRAAAAARELLPALRPALESDDLSLVEYATEVYRAALLGLVLHLRRALCAAVALCSPNDRLVGALRSRLASALQNAANEPAVALQAYTAAPDGAAEAPEQGSRAEVALAVRRCREEAVAHERAAIVIEKLNPRAEQGSGAAQDLMGMLPCGTLG
jgi:hypothetical protein